MEPGAPPVTGKNVSATSELAQDLQRRGLQVVGLCDALGLTDGVMVRHSLTSPKLDPLAYRLTPSGPKHTIVRPL